MDVACSSFSESSAIFGGEKPFKAGIENVIRQYDPAVIGIITTCLSETIGENMEFLVRSFEWDHEHMPRLISVSTPSYRDSHTKGFQSAIRQIVASLATPGPAEKQVNILTSMISPADIRYVREICDDLQVEAVIMPDYSDSLDGGTWSEYQRTHAGGTTLKALESSGRAQGSLDLSYGLYENVSAARLLQEQFSVPATTMGLPIGIRKTDLFFETLADISGGEIPAKHTKERGRLLDSYIDGHKYVFGKRAVVYGEEDLVIGIAAFLTEVGIMPVLCATGGDSGKFETALKSQMSDCASQITVLEDADFADIEAMTRELGADMLIGNSNGYKLARELAIPLIRVGMPVHDRIGASRIMHIGYRGTQQLFDRIVNALIQTDQDSSPVGYIHM
jgi:nitrogenase molybdenum-iron protein NifN